ncbi:LysR family transcriptional regulator [Streptomyces sp. KLOTTS4A1]|uniref:LysR family transcriptional regulator n=1 Tax=Streptomyces sp. KLOTTS4A1 TaxID=3390996 RepID=UPI0039F517EC
MPFRDPDPRLLRHFAAVAEELHFTRAAARLYIAQQALSRDIRRLEQQLGTELFSRTTRQVQLTPDGERLLPHARAVLAAYDELDAAWTTHHRPLLVDVGARISTAYLVLEAARLDAPDVDFAARFHTGLTGAAADILAGRLDVSSGLHSGLPEATRGRLEHRLIRYERMAVLLPATHPLAGLPEIPLAALRGETLYAAAGNEATAEWTALARRLLTPHGVHLAPPFPEIAGEQEFIRTLRKHGWSVLATTQFTDVPGMTLRPLCDPVPLSPVSLVWRRGLTHPGLAALHEAATCLAAEGNWLGRPTGAWVG